jgi:hypothetical protein
MIILQAEDIPQIECKNYPVTTKTIDSLNRRHTKRVLIDMTDKEYERTTHYIKLEEEFKRNKNGGM